MTHDPEDRRHIGARPIIESLSVDPPAVAPGGAAILYWRTRNAVKVFIDGQPAAPNGSMTIACTGSERRINVSATSASGLASSGQVALMTLASCGPAFCGPQSIEARPGQALDLAQWWAPATGAVPLALSAAGPYVSVVDGKLVIAPDAPEGDYVIELSADDGR